MTELPKEYLEFIEKVRKEKEEKELAYKKALDEDIKKIKEIGQSDYLKEKFNTLKILINATIKSKDIHSFVIQGSQGIGKTFATAKTLTESDIEFVSINGHISPMQLYQYMYDNNGKVIVIDDNGSLLKNPLSLSIMLNALWGINEKRSINWLSTTEKLTAPPSFDFDGKIIYLTNSFPDNLENMKSRVYFYDFILTFSEKIRMIYEIAKVRGMNMEVCDFIRDFATPAHNIDLRTLVKINDLKKQTAEWKEIGKKILEVDEKNAMIIELMKKTNSTVESAKLFRLHTGDSTRMFYYRWKKIRKDIEI